MNQKSMEKCIESQMLKSKAASGEKSENPDVKSIWLDTKDQYIYDFIPSATKVAKCDVIQSVNRYIEPTNLPEGKFIYKASILSPTVDDRVHKFYFPSELISSPETSAFVMETIQVKSSDGFDAVEDINNEIIKMESENNIRLSSLATEEQSRRDVEAKDKKNKELKGMLNEEDCLYCSLKHVSTAYALWNEFQGNPEYKLEFIMSLGELRAAELHLVNKYPELCVAVRELRLAIESGARVFQEFREMMLAMAERAELFA